MPTSLETSLEQLKAERKPLADLFNKHPQRLHLAIRIKSIDDQIAKCTEVIRSAAQRGADAESRLKRAKS
jgi:hypothetical protein